MQIFGVLSKTAFVYILLVMALGFVACKKKQEYITRGTIYMDKVWKWEDFCSLTPKQAVEQLLGDTITVVRVDPAHQMANLDEVPNAPALGYCVPKGFSKDFPNFKGDWGTGIGVFYNWPNDAMIQRQIDWNQPHIDSIDAVGIPIPEKIDGECKFDPVTGDCFWNAIDQTLSVKVVGVKDWGNHFGLHSILLGIRYPKASGASQ